MDKYSKLVLLFFLLIRQMGGIADCLRKMPEDTSEAGWRAYIQSELSDILTLTRRCCELLELDYKEVEALGLQRDAEKKAEYLKRHPSAWWV